MGEAGKSAGNHEGCIPLAVGPQRLPLKNKDLPISHYVQRLLSGETPFSALKSSLSRKMEMFCGAPVFLERWVRGLRYRDPADTQRVPDALGKAGLK